MASTEALMPIAKSESVQEKVSEEYGEKFEDIDESEYQRILKELNSQRREIMQRKSVQIVKAGGERPENIEKDGGSSNYTEDFNFFDRLFNASNSSIAPVFKKSQFG